MSEFYFIRHGQTDWNAKGLWQGSTDTDLNDTGRAQAQAAILHLSDLGITRIITSPLKRCVQTAAIVNEALRLPVTESEHLRERCFGKLNGTHKDEIGDIEQHDHEALQIEPLAAVVQRATSTIEAAFIQYPKDRILFVSHGGVFRAVHTHFCGDNLSSDNAVPYRFFRENGVWQSQRLQLSSPTSEA